MSMTITSRRELYKLRELVHFLLVGQVCEFCKKPISTQAEQFKAHGNATGPKLLDRITIHHINDVHSDNTHGNKALCHTKCHKSYHRTLANQMRALKAPYVQGEM